MIRRHLTPALAAFLVCLSLCLSWQRTRSIGPWLLPAALVPAGAAICAFHHGRGRAGILFVGACAGALLGLAAVARMDNATAGSFLPVSEEDVSRFSGVVREDSSLSQKGWSVLRLDLRGASSTRTGVAGSARGRVLVLVSGDYRFSIGQSLAVASPLAPSSGGTGSDTWIAFVQRKDLRTLGYASQVWAARAAVREWLHRSVSLVGYPGSALLEALLIGGRDDIPDDLYGSFRRTGSLHILALSGMHVTVLYGIVAGLLRFLRNRRATFVLAVIVLLLYQFVAGFMPSLLRATVMIIVGGVGLLADRDGEPLNLLAVAGLVLLAMDPFAASSLSFQLSFLAIAGMITIGALVERILMGRVPPVALVPLAFSLGAQAATLPLVVGQFGAFYPSGIIAGLLLVPLTTAFLWAGLAWLPLSVIPWPVLHSVCASAFGTFYRVIAETAGFFARLPGIPFGLADKTWFIPLAAAAVVFAATALPLRRGSLRARLT